MPQDAQFQILLVEDSRADVRMVFESLKDVAPVANVSVAADGVDALRFLRREGNFSAAPRPDLILLDLRMPRKNGFQVLKEVKQDAALSCIPVVVLSSSALEMDVSRAYHLRADYYIAKPYDVDEFTKDLKFLVEFWMTIAALPEGEHNGEGSWSLPHQTVARGISHGLGNIGARETRTPRS